VTALADEYGVEMAMDVDRYLQIDARNAQLVALGVRRDAPDRFRAFHAAVFDALWTGTRDVGDAAVLRDLTASAGVGPDRVETWLADEELQERFASSTAVASADGVRGVPALVRDGDGRVLSGSQPVSGYRRFLEG
jgi:predicted DsbA family dithiol-disulfide isomerase